MERTVAKCLLEIKSIYFGLEKEITTKGGNRLPLYCDNRMIFIYPRVRKVLSKWITTLVMENYPDVEMFIGTTVSGVALSVVLAESLNLPACYVLDNGGEENSNRAHLDEVIKPGTKVVIIDDVIRSGTTVLGVADYLKKRGCNVIGATAIFSYELEETKKKLEIAGIKYCALTNFDVVSLIGMQIGKISYPEYLKLLKFKNNPSNNDWLN